jgi:hypothetical protein
MPKISSTTTGISQASRALPGLAHSAASGAKSIPNTMSPTKPVASFTETAPGRSKLHGMAGVARFHRADRA